MGANYLSVTLPGDVKEQMDAITAAQLVDAIRSSDMAHDTVTVAWEMDLDDPGQVQQLLEALRDSVADMSHWGKSAIKGVEFYQMGGDSWGDDPYEGFTEHVVVAEVMSALGKL